jgi:hypothetical protein
MTRWKQEENRGSIPRLVMVSLPNHDGPLTPRWVSPFDRFKATPVTIYKAIKNDDNHRQD